MKAILGPARRALRAHPAGKKRMVHQSYTKHTCMGSVRDN